MFAIRGKLTLFALAVVAITAATVMFAESPRALAAAVLVAALIAALGAGRLAQHLSEPIHDLKRAINRYRTGGDALPTPLNRRDEFGELAWALRLMIDEIHKTHPNPPERRSRARDRRQATEDVEAAVRSTGVDADLGDPAGPIPTPAND